MLCKLGLHKWRDKFGKKPYETTRLGYSVECTCVRCGDTKRFRPGL